MSASIEELATFLVELGSAPPVVPYVPAVQEAVAGLPEGGVEGEDVVSADPPVVLRYSDRGQIGEPGDSLLPNVPYPPRISALPTLNRDLPLYPEGGNRLNFTAGTMTLSNADGALNVVAGAWNMAGRQAIIRRGPYLRPRHADLSLFRTLASLRINSAPMGTDQVQIELRDAASDLTTPVSSPFAGTGGTEGPASMIGTARNVVLGQTTHTPLQPLIPAENIWLASALSLNGIGAVFDRGKPVNIAAVYASLDALRQASIPNGQCATCPAAGCVRFSGFVPTIPTANCLGAAGSDPAQMIRALLTGPGGLSLSAIDTAALALLPTGTSQGGAGLLLGAGSVADAMNAIMAGISGWWGITRAGLITAGRVLVPETATPAFKVERWMLQEEPTEIAGQAPRQRAVVRYGQLGRTFSSTDLATSVDSDTAAFLARGYNSLPLYYGDVAIQFPSSNQTPDDIESIWAAVDTATLQAQYVMDCHAKRRRKWNLNVGRFGHLFDLGQPIVVDHPKLAGQTWIPYGSMETGDDIRRSVWG